MEIAGILKIKDVLHAGTEPAHYLCACLNELKHGQWESTGDFLRHYPRAGYSGKNEFRIPVFEENSLFVQLNFPLNHCRIIRFV